MARKKEEGQEGEQYMTTEPTLSESATVKEMKQGLKDLIDLIKMHEKLAYNAKKAKNPEAVKMHKNHLNGTQLGLVTKFILFFPQPNVLMQMF